MQSILRIVQATDQPVAPIFLQLRHCLRSDLIPVVQVPVHCGQVLFYLLQSLFPNRILVHGIRNGFQYPSIAF